MEVTDPKKTNLGNIVSDMVFAEVEIGENDAEDEDDGVENAVIYGQDFINLLGEKDADTQKEILEFKDELLSLEIRRRQIVEILNERYV